MSGLQNITVAEASEALKTLIFSGILPESWLDNRMFIGANQDILASARALNFSALPPNFIPPERNKHEIDAMMPKLLEIINGDQPDETAKQASFIAHFLNKFLVQKYRSVDIDRVSRKARDERVGKITQIILDKHHKGSFFAPQEPCDFGLIDLLREVDLLPTIVESNMGYADPRVERNAAWQMFNDAVREKYASQSDQIAAEAASSKPECGDDRRKVAMIDAIVNGTNKPAFANMQIVLEDSIKHESHLEWRAREAQRANNDSTPSAGWSPLLN